MHVRAHARQPPAASTRTEHNDLCLRGDSTTRRGCCWPHAIWFSEVPELSDSSVDHFPTLGVMPFAKKVQLVLVNSRQPTTYYADLVKKQKDSDGDRERVEHEEGMSSPSMAHWAQSKTKTMALGYDDIANAPSACFCTEREAGRVFPESFYPFLHNPHASTAGGDGGDAPFPSDSEAQIERIWREYDSVEAYIVPEADLAGVREAESGGVKVDYEYSGEVAGTPMMDILPVELHSQLLTLKLKAPRFDVFYKQTCKLASRAAFRVSRGPIQPRPAGRSLEEYILLWMIQALPDVEEMIVFKVLETLTSLCELGLLQRIPPKSVFARELPHSPQHPQNISPPARCGPARLTLPSAFDPPGNATRFWPFIRPHPPAKRRPSELRLPRWNKTHRSNAHRSSWIALGRVEAWDIEEPTLDIHTLAPIPNLVVKRLRPRRILIRTLTHRTEFNGHRSGHGAEARQFGSESNPQSRAFEKGFMISESGLKSAVVGYREDGTNGGAERVYGDVASNANRPPQRISLITNNQQSAPGRHDRLGVHRCAVQGQYSERRSGRVIKVWRVDGAEHH
ncbi:hypothetical protein FIBSPDRAFT_895236 [Athelia psychrophila]|uniref:Phosphatase 2A Regulatory Subunit A helical domain-containing protein n=1 Tax=Athelia psychrophila TaxID=1759441 RepID=A0A166EWR1_9AGAM|nr:hypothetical protein FIBSPDRAFT_895236 [Fibularhizoctonia sp. CBS 109695]